MVKICFSCPFSWPLALEVVGWCFTQATKLPQNYSAHWSLWCFSSPLELEDEGRWSVTSHKATKLSQNYSTPAARCRFQPDVICRMKDGKEILSSLEIEVVRWRKAMSCFAQATKLPQDHSAKATKLNFHNTAQHTGCCDVFLDHLNLKMYIGWRNTPPTLRQGSNMGPICYFLGPK